MDNRICRILTLIATLCTISGIPAIARAGEGGKVLAIPDSAGMSTARLERIGHVMRQYIQDRRIAGAVTLVARKGSVVHLEAHGYRDAERKIPMTTDVIFRIASMTKPITSVALMMLWEEGKINLQDPVAQYLPEFLHTRVSTTGDASGRTGELAKPKRAMTIRQLLTHTAGLANRYIGNGGFYDEHMDSRDRQPSDTLEGYVKRLAELPLNYHPGEKWQYSHATDVIARIVEAVSGLDYASFLQQRIFGPLGMADTSHYLDALKAHRLAAQYAPDETGRITLQDPGSAESRWVAGPKTLFRGAGDLLSTAEDYLRFQQMMLNGGQIDGVRILGRKTIELMFVNHTGDLPIWLGSPGTGFGLGYAVMLDRGQAGTALTEGSVWWGGAYGTQFWIDPEEELIGILMIQVRPNNHLDVRLKFRNLVYQAIVD